MRQPAGDRNSTDGIQTKPKGTKKTYNNKKSPIPQVQDTQGYLKGREEFYSGSQTSTSLMAEPAAHPRMSDCAGADFVRPTSKKKKARRKHPRLYRLIITRRGTRIKVTRYLRAREKVRSGCQHKWGNYSRTRWAKQEKPIAGNK